MKKTIQSIIKNLSLVSFILLTSCTTRQYYNYQDPKIFWGSKEQVVLENAGEARVRVLSDGAHTRSVSFKLQVDAGKEGLLPSPKDQNVNEMKSPSVAKPLFDLDLNLGYELQKSSEDVWVTVPINDNKRYDSQERKLVLKFSDVQSGVADPKDSHTIYVVDHLGPPSVGWENSGSSAMYDLNGVSQVQAQLLLNSEVDEDIKISLSIKAKLPSDIKDSVNCKTEPLVMQKTVTLPLGTQKIPVLIKAKGNDGEMCFDTTTYQVHIDSVSGGLGMGPIRDFELNVRDMDNTGSCIPEVDC
jgi:hypothetical protein